MKENGGGENLASCGKTIVVCPAGYSKGPDFSPAQPWRLFHPPTLSLPRQTLRPRTRLGPGKAAVSYHFIRGARDYPNCARPTTGVLDRALREHGDRPSQPAHFIQHPAIECLPGVVTTVHTSRSDQRRPVLRHRSSAYCQIANDGH